jgi:hypothetical protein
MSEFQPLQESAQIRRADAGSAQTRKCADMMLQRAPERKQNSGVISRD